MRSKKIVLKSTSLMILLVFIGAIISSPTFVKSTSHYVAAQQSEKMPDSNLFENYTMSSTNVTYVGSDIEISNEYLKVHVYSTGGFTAETADGKDILYPGDTSDFTVKIGNNEYSVDHSTIQQYLVAGPYLSQENQNEVIIQWKLPEGVEVEQHISLQGEKIQFKVLLKNLNNTPVMVSIRYLWDTQLESNDGAPLAVDGNMYFNETEFEPVTFSYWSAYSSISDASLVTYAWWETVPTRIIFGYWPWANDYPYYYEPHPNQPFTSDSCVLMYWENITIPSYGEKSIIVYYGTSNNIGTTLKLNLERTTFYPGEDVVIQAKPQDTEDNVIYPMNSENTHVYFNGKETNINSVTPTSSGWYIIRATAPSIPGEYTLSVTFVTPEGSAANSTTISVFPNVNAQIFIDTSKDVDANTRHWKYPTHYNVPVYRRGIDTPIFGVRLENDNLEGYQLKIEIYDPYYRRIATLYSEPLTSTPTSTSIEWNWDNPLEGTYYLPTDIPVGIYYAKYYLTKGDSSILLGTEEFYVIFDFTEEDQYFVTVDKEPDYSSPLLFGDPMRHDVYNLHLWNERIWKKALEWINGAKTIEEAVERISKLARNIDGTMIYHHSQNDETWIFEMDLYDNNFDGIIDDLNESWKFNYDPAWMGAMSPISGRAYIRSLTLIDVTPLTFPILPTIPWVDSEGHVYSIKELWFMADKIAWYFDVLDMLNEDFDPENRIPHQHSLGVCEDYAMLTVAYMRGVGIKSRVVTAEGSKGGHAWVHWWNPEQNGWKHLDTDYFTQATVWTANRFDPGEYTREGWKFYHVYVRTWDPEDPQVIDLQHQYNDPFIDENAVFHDEGSGAGARSVSPIIPQSMESTQMSPETNEEPTLQYYLPENETIVIGQEKILNVTVNNPTDESRTVNVTLAIYPLPPLEQVNLSPIWNATEETTIPAHSTEIASYSITLPNTTLGGSYYLKVFENKTTLRNETLINIVPPFTYEIHYNESELVLNKPSQFDIVIKNPTSIPMENVTVMLNTYNGFNTSEELTKHVQEIAPGEEYTFSWTLIPDREEKLMLGVEVYTLNMGSSGKIIYPKVLSPPKFHVDYNVPEAVEPGSSFTLNITLENYGDLAANNVTVHIVLPNNTEIIPGGIDIGTINGHTNVSIEIPSIKVTSTTDFAILVNISSTTTNYSEYILVNIINPQVIMDILGPSEVYEGYSHQDAVIIPVNNPTTLTIYLANIGDEDITNAMLIINNEKILSIGTIEKGSVKQIPIEHEVSTTGLSDIQVTLYSDQLTFTISRLIFGVNFNLIINTPKTQFSPNETIPINITVKNMVPGIRFSDLQLHVKLIDTSGNIIVEDIEPILSISPLEEDNIKLYFTLPNTTSPQQVTVSAELLLQNTSVATTTIGIEIAGEQSPTIGEYLVRVENTTKTYFVFNNLGTPDAFSVSQYVSPTVPLNARRIARLASEFDLSVLTANDIIISVGGPLVNPVTAQYEDIAPVHMVINGGVITIVTPEGNVTWTAPRPWWNVTEGYFIIQVFEDPSGAFAVTIYGTDADSTAAGAYYFLTTIYPTIESYTNVQYVVGHWQDTEPGADIPLPGASQGDTSGFSAGDTITIIAKG